MLAGSLLVTISKSFPFKHPRKLSATKEWPLMSTNSQRHTERHHAEKHPRARGGRGAPLCPPVVWEERAWGWCTPTHICTPGWHDADLPRHQSCCHLDDRSCTRAVPLHKAGAVYNFPPSARPPCVNQDGSQSVPE